MKTEQKFYRDSWDDMTHGSRRREISFDILGWWAKRQAKKLKDIIGRSQAYWAKKRQRRRVVKMLRLQRKFERAMRDVKGHAHV